MARWKAHRHCRSLAKIAESVKRNEGDGTGRGGPGLIYCSRERAGEPQSSSAQGQGCEGLDSMLLGGYSEAMRARCPIYWAAIESRSSLRRGTKGAPVANGSIGYI